MFIATTPAQLADSRPDAGRKLVGRPSAPVVQEDDDGRGVRHVVMDRHHV